MLLKWMKTAIVKNKNILILSVVIIMYEMINTLEEHILENIALISSEPRRRLKQNPENYSCPYTPSNELDYIKGQEATFFWTEQQITSVKIILYNIPCFTLLFGGIYSDKYGGHRVVLLGLLVCAFVMSTCYLFMLNNNNIFLAMLVLRKSSQGMVWAAFFSLAGKLAKSDQRTIFVSVLLAGESVGEYLGYVIPTIVVKWKPISMFSGFVGFVTAISWWIIYRSSQFPKVRRIKHIPWKKLMTTVSLYSIGFLLISCWIINLIIFTDYESYTKDVLFFDIDQGWVIRFAYYLSRIFGALFCGFLSDYIIFKKYLPASAVKRIVYSLCIVIVFCTLVVLKVVKCDRIIVKACSIPLHFASAVAWATTMTSVIDFSPLCSGAITGTVNMFSIFMYFPFHSTLSEIFVPDDSKSDMNSWSGLFFTLFFLSLVTSLPSICGGIKETSPRIEGSIRRQDMNNELDDTSASESAQVGQQQSFHGINPNPSNSHFSLMKIFK